MRETVAWARELLGGNGIVLDYDVGRFFADAEALYSYEGTHQMNNLIVGKADHRAQRLRLTPAAAPGRAPQRAPKPALRFSTIMRLDLWQATTFFPD